MIRNGSDPRPSQVAIDNILGYLFDAVVEAPPIRSPTDAEPRHRFIPGRSHLDRRAAPGLRPRPALGGGLAVLLVTGLSCWLPGRKAVGPLKAQGGAARGLGGQAVLLLRRWPRRPGGTPRTPPGQPRPGPGSGAVRPGRHEACRLG